MEELKQVIVVRSDLKNSKGHKVRTGKIISQCCHASVSAIFDTTKYDTNKDMYYEWLKTGQTKITVAVNSLEELEEIYEKAKAAKLPVYLVIDAGRTEFAEPTKTCLAIGPYKAKEIDLVTGHLSLF